MRLLGSLTEDDIRRRLSASNAALRAGNNPLLRAALLSCGVDLRTAFVLHWIPEQAEDIYTVLDGTRQVLTIELARGDSSEPTEVDAIPLADYSEAVARGSRSERLQFAVAMDLLREASDDSA
ncbi:hypothetical protein AB1L88_03920 [Tautonia sp. JC769]|uniref:hypothetical protein n=1 Tax=Tautonia sp. JC769 TaxID=3232135 RepID=UPI003459AF0D